MQFRPWRLGPVAMYTCPQTQQAWSSSDLQVLKVENLLLCAVIPAQQGQEVEHGLRQEALLTELAGAGGSMPLAQLALVWSQD